MMSPLDKVTILIVTWKGDQLLKDCLDSIVKAMEKVPPVVVVDNANLDSTAKLCAGYPFVTYAAAPENLGFAGGNNLGLPLCKTEYVVLLNNDTIVEEEPFTAMAEYADAHPEVGVVGGKLWAGPDCPEGTLNGAGAFLTKWGYMYSHAFLKKDGPEFSYPLPVFAAGGALMLVKKAVIASVGGILFYDHFKSYYEEVDFCHRLWIAGWEVHSIPSPKVRHLCFKTTSKFSFESTLNQYYRNIFFSHAVNLNGYGWWRVALPFRFLYFASMLLRLVKGKWRQARDMARILWRMRDEKAAIASARKILQAARKRSDREVFKYVVHPLPFSYFWQSIRVQ